MYQKKKFPFEIRVRLRSFNIYILESLKKRFQIIALDYHLDYSSINLPVDKKKITVLKSPHVNKKAREQFEIRISNCLLTLRGFVPDSSIYKRLERMESEDVLLKLTIITKYV